jgi:hypothetical protein
MRDPILPKLQLLKEMQRFAKDKNRGISLHLFAELSGISFSLFRDVFIHELLPMTESTQIRVSRAYAAFKRGEVAVMQNRDNTRFPTYRKEPKPVYIRSTGLHVVDGQIKIKVGIRNKADYSGSDLDEQLGGKHG